MQEEQKQYEKNEKMQANVPEINADMDEDKPDELEQEAKVVGKSLKSHSFYERMKDRMRDKIISYIDLL